MNLKAFRIFLLDTHQKNSSLYKFFDTKNFNLHELSPLISSYLFDTPTAKKPTQRKKQEDEKSSPPPLTRLTQKK